MDFLNLPSASNFRHYPRPFFTCMDIPGVIVSQIAYMRLPLYTAVDRPGLEPEKSSSYEAAALTNFANDPYYKKYMQVDSNNSYMLSMHVC